MADGDSIFAPLTPLNLDYYQDHPFLPRSRSRSPRSPLRAQFYCPPAIAVKKIAANSNGEALRPTLTRISVEGKTESRPSSRDGSSPTLDSPNGTFGLDVKAFAGESFIDKNKTTMGKRTHDVMPEGSILDVDGPEDFTENLMAYFTTVDAPLKSKVDQKSLSEGVGNVSEKKHQDKSTGIEAPAPTFSNTESEGEAQSAARDTQKCKDSDQQLHATKPHRQAGSHDQDRGKLIPAAMDMQGGKDMQEETLVRKHEFEHHTQQVMELEKLVLDKQKSIDVLQQKLTIMEHEASQEDSLHAREEQLKMRERKLLEKEHFLVAKEKNLSQEGKRAKVQQDSTDAAELASMKSEVERLKKTIDKQQSEIVEKDAQNHKLNELLQQNQQDISKLESVKSGLEQQVKVQGSTLAAKETEIALMKIELHHKVEQIQNLHEISDDISELESTKATVEKLTAQLDAQKVTVSELNAEKESLKIVLKQHKEQIHASTLAGLENQKKWNSDRAQLAQLKKSNLSMKFVANENKKLKVLVAQLQHQVQNLKVLEAAKEASLKASKTEVTNLKEQLMEQKATAAKVQALEKAAEDHKTQLRIYQDAEEDANWKLSECKRRWNDYKADAAQRVADLVSHYEIKLQKISDRYKDQKIKIKELRAKLEEEVEEKEKRGKMIMNYMAKEEGAAPGPDGRMPFKYRYVD